MALAKIICRHREDIGLDEAVETSLQGVLNPMVDMLESYVDLGLYFYEATRCETFCADLDEPECCSMLLWAVCCEIRKESTGYYSLESQLALKSSKETPKRVASKPMALFGSSLDRAVAPSALKKLQLSLKRRHKISSNMLSSCRKVGDEPSSAMKELPIRTKVSEGCLKLLVLLGTSSPRYEAYFGDGSRVPSDREREYLLKLFFQSQGRAVQPKTVNGYRKEIVGLLEWLTSIALPLECCTSFHVATWLNDMGSRGASIPGRCLGALVWATSVFQVEVWIVALNDDGVRLEGKGPRDRPPAKPARCPAIEIMVKLELLIVDECAPLVYRVMAGVCCTLCHGGLRWQDFQSSECLDDAPDALLGRSYMKHQGLRSWVSLKVGFAKVDWGTPFLALLRENGMPCDGYILKRPATNLCGFQNKPCTFANGLHAMRFLFVAGLGMEATEACTFSLHGFRHVLITCGRQLSNPLSPSEQNEINHWTEDSRMARRYDAVASSSELQAKVRVTKAFQNGERLLEPGELRRDCMESPVKVPRTLSSSDPSGFVSMVHSPGNVVLPSVSNLGGDLAESADEVNPFGLPTAAQDEVDAVLQDIVTVCSEGRPVQEAYASVFPEGVLPPKQVEHEKQGKLHLYADHVKTLTSVCGMWRCGTPEHPTRFASFLSSWDTIPLTVGSFAEGLEPCGSCFKEGTLVKHGWHECIPTRSVLLKVDSGSSVCASDCSSDSSSEG